MPIAASDIKTRLSVTTGSAGGSTAQGNPNASLGTYISTTDISGTPLDNLFNDLTGDQQAAGQVDYRCMFVYNSHATLTYQTPKIWLSGFRSTAVASTDVITASGHGMATNDEVRVEAELNTDTIPAGLANNTNYFLTSVTTNTFKLSATNGGSAIDITADSSGFATRQWGYTTMQIGLDPTGIMVYTGAIPQATSIASTTGVPPGVSFSAPTTKAAGLAPSNLTAGFCQAVWVQRTALNTGARNADGVTLGVSGDTAA